MYGKLGSRWEAAVGLVSQSAHDAGQAQSIGFVNCVATRAGLLLAPQLGAELVTTGTHVNFVSDVVASEIAAHINKQHKELKVSPATVRCC